MRVNLTYFKRTGKYYTSGSYETEHKPIYQVFEEVCQMRDEGRLPGLVEGHSDYIVSIDVPDHEHNHPHLIV